MQNSDRYYDQLGATKQAFVDWLCTPKRKREIDTQIELSDELGVSQTSLSKWKHRPDVMQAVRERKRELVGVDGVNKVIDALTRRASKVNDNAKEANDATEIFFKWLYGEDMNDGMTLNINQNQAQSSENQDQTETVDLSEQIENDPELRNAYRRIRKAQQEADDRQ